MKITTILLAILVIAVGVMTCKNFQKKQTTVSAVQPQPAPVQEKTYPWKASHVIEGSRPDSALGAYQVKAPPRMVQVPVDALPAPSASKKAYLSTGWWHLNMAFQPSDTTIHHHYQQKWLKFREDQTFDILIKGKVVDTGRWNFDQNRNEILLSCNDPYINNSWVVKESGFVMIWKGNTDINVTGIQIRVVGQKQEPKWQ